MNKERGLINTHLKSYRVVLDENKKIYGFVDAFRAKQIINEYNQIMNRRMKLMPARTTQRRINKWTMEK
jgi:hypothetical protein